MCNETNKLGSVDKARFLCPFKCTKKYFSAALALKWAELREGGFAHTARENKCIEIPPQIAAS